MIEIEVCHDTQYLIDVLLNDGEMYARSADDFTPDDIAKSFSSAVWLTGFRSLERVGLVSVRPVSSSVLNIHIHVPKQHRGKGTLEFGRQALRWVVANSNSKFFKINTKVPVIYKDVIRFAHKLGFRDEGLDRLSIMKNGKIIDRVNLGITFDEIKT